MRTQRIQTAVASGSPTAQTIFSFTSETGTTLYFDGSVVVTRTGGAGGAAGDSYTYKLSHKMSNIGGTVADVGAALAIDQRESDLTANLAFVVTSSNIVNLQFTAPANVAITVDSDFVMRFARN